MGSQALLVLTMLLEGVSFGSLYTWGILGHQGKEIAAYSFTRRNLGICSALGSILLLDKDSCDGFSKFSKLDITLIILHLVFSLQRGMDTKFAGLGPWTAEQPGVTFPLLAAIVHFRAFLHLFIQESQRSFAKRAALIASFYLGAKLPYM